MATTYPSKSPDLIPLGDGLNFSSPLAQVSGTVVPNPIFFLRSNNPPPSVTSDQWQLHIDGRVRSPLTIGFDDLRRLGNQTQQEVWMECAGNSRRRFDPPGEGNQWDDQAVSDARFTGVPLRVLLERCGVEPDAIELVTTGADNDANSVPFQRGLPLDVALKPEVMLAWEMNGEPIPPPNGGPVRLLVPRWAGIASVKWPVHMELVSTPFKGYFNAERYIFVDGDGRTVGAVREMPVKSIIASPAHNALVPAAPLTAFGFAWSGLGEIERVDVSTDDRRTWSPARLIRGDGPLAWTRWEFEWMPAQSGPASLSLRATDTAGNVQPEQAAWNKFGYLMNAIVTHRLTIS